LYERAVSDRDDLAHERARRLRFDSMLAGDMFLPAALMISLLLPVDDRQVAVLVERADVPGPQPSVLGEGLGVLLREVPVARASRNRL